MTTSVALPTVADNAPQASVVMGTLSPVVTGTPVGGLPTTSSVPRDDGALCFSALLGQANIAPEPTAAISLAVLTPGDSGRTSAGFVSSEKAGPTQSVPDDLPAMLDGGVTKQPCRVAGQGRSGGSSARQILMRRGVPEETSVDAVTSNQVATSSMPPQSSPRREKSTVSVPALPDASESSAGVNVAPLSAEMAAVAMPIMDVKVEKPCSLLEDSGAEGMTAAPRSGEIPASADRPGQGMPSTVEQRAPSAQRTEVTKPTVPYADARRIDADPPAKNEPVSPTDTAKKSPAIDVPAPMPAGNAGESVTPHAVAMGKISIEAAPAKTEEKNAPAKNILRSLPVISLREPSSDNFLNVDGKELTRSVNRVGTEAAKDDSTMATRFNAPTSARDQEGVFPVRSDVVNSVSAPVVQASAGTGQVTEAHVSRAAEAVDVIREVVSMTDDLRSRERSSVEVQFQFKDNARLDVRVAYRDGEVQTTFRTDSPELRETLNREWQLQAVAPAAETKPYRLADPVFISTEMTSSQPGGFGGDTSRQSSQHQARPGSDGLANTIPASVAGGSRSLGDITDRPVPSTRPDTVRHLHVFA